jgi:hypothetical protein
MVAGPAVWERNTDPLVIEWQSSADAGEVSLRASSLPGLALFYRMDTRRPRGDKIFRWRTNLIEKVELAPGDIGLVAWREEQIGGASREVLIPVSLGARSAEAQKSFSVILATTQVLTKLDLTLREVAADGGYGATAFERGVSSGPLVPSRPIGPIQLTVPLKAGLYHLRVRAQLMDPTSADDTFRTADFVVRLPGTN